MISYNGQIYCIVPDDDLFVSWMREFDPDYIELKYWGRMRNPDGTVATGYQWWAVGLDLIEEWARETNREIIWVCPD